MSTPAGELSGAEILLVQPPMEEFYLTAKRTVPYGLACIAASLEQAGFSVSLADALAVGKSKIIPPPRELGDLDRFYGRNDLSPFALFHHYRHYGYSFEHMGTLAREKRPFLVGISSLFTAYCNEALETARTIKRFWPECRVVMGGHHPTLFPEAVMGSPAVDFVLRGEGEVSMPLLALALKNNTSLEDVPGIVYRINDGTLHQKEPAWMEDLDAFPLPATDLVDHGFYQRKQRASISIVAARGCPMHCTYCCLGASSAHAPFRRRSVESVMAELDGQMERREVGFIDFEDENLSLDKKWFLSLLKEITTRFRGRDMELRAMNGLYAPSLDEEIVAAMKAAGFRTLNLSLGSTSREQLARFKRPDVRKALDRCLDLARAFSMEAVSYLIGAAPGQKPEQSVQDLLYLGARRTLVGFSVFYPAPGSHDFQLCKNRGLLPPAFAGMRSTAFPVSDTTTRLQAATLLRLARLLNFMKALVDDGELPGPCRISDSGAAMAPHDRRDAGKRLLAAFLHDNRIRGFSRDGAVFEHPVDKLLVRRFAEGLAKINVQGVKSVCPLRIGGRSGNR
ncbi:MAG: B12-binding domain-containing radical SAM protein [Desulfobacteraceae bacterium]|nr:B12-binding domain-containing radical SAM protein [Desulfobacteraceae bacterium]